MNSFKKTVGERIRRHRKAMGFKTQQAFADALGVDQPRVNKWETGNNFPDEPHRERICEILQVSEAELFGVSDEPIVSNPAGKSELIASIVLGLSALDETELRTLLSHVNNFAALKEVSKKQGAG